MNPTRRNCLQAVSGTAACAVLVALGLVRPTDAAAAQVAAQFRTHGVPATLAAMGIEDLGESSDLVLDAPDIADNGSVVAITIGSRLPDTDMLAVLVDRNPNALAAVYEIIGIEPRITMRIKMGESSDVRVLARAGGKYYMARRQVRVTIGGCGA